MGDQADILIEQIDDAHAKHLAGDCDDICPWCEHDEEPETTSSDVENIADYCDRMQDEWRSLK